MDDNDYNDDDIAYDESVSQYMPDRYVNVEDVYDIMHKEYEQMDKQIRQERIFRDDLDPDDILMQLNMNELIDKDNRVIEDLIDKGLETRFFQNDPNSFLNSRVGMNERIGHDTTLSTIMHGTDKLTKRQEAINRMYMNTQEIFSLNFKKACDKYSINIKTVESIMPLLFKSNYFEYKNPYGIIFGFLCIKGRDIDIKKLNNVYDKYAVNENITKLDLIRYARFLQSLL
jgi:hypothetical protein